MRSQLIYTNRTSQRPAASVSADTFTFAPFLVGKSYALALRHLDRINGRVTEVFPKIRAIRANVGFDDLRPTAGSTGLQVGPGASAAGNTLTLIGPTEDVASLKTKLNALADITPHDFEVESDQGSYFIRRASGEQFALTVRNNHFRPLSFVRLRQWQDARGWVSEVRFIQSSLAFTDTASPVLPPQPSFDPVADGVDYGNGLKQNEVQNLVIPPAFRGQFYIVYKKTDISSPVRTRLLSRSDGPAQYKAAMDEVLAADGGIMTVTNPEVGKARFEFGGDLAGINIPLLTVEVPEEGTPPGDWTLELDLNTVEAWSAVRGLKPGEMLEVPFDLEMDVPEDDENDESPSKTIPLWTINIQLKRPLTWEGLATAQSVNWLRKPNPKTYLPYNQTQVGIGQLHYESAVFGDGDETHFEFDHNLAVAGLTGVQVIDITDGRVLVHGTDYTAHTANAGNTLELDFPEAPAVDSLKLFVSTPQPIEFFINDLEIEIAQVSGLAAIISDLTGRVETLEEIVIPGVAAGSADSSAMGLVTVIPEISEILLYRKEMTADLLEDPAELFTADGLDAARLLSRRRPYMLPAVHDGTLTDPLPDPLPAPAAGTVWVANGRTLIPGAGGVRSAYVEDDGHVASDGRSLFVAARDGATNSYYPAAFERTLFAMAVNSDMLAVTRTLEILFGIQTQLIHATCKAQWILSVQLGAFSADTDPATLGLNLANVTWSTPVFSQAIVLSRLAQSHFFGTRIKRTATEFLLDQQKYGIWAPNNAAAPGSANFAIRATLDRFDTENKTDPRGYVAWKLIGSIEIGEDGTQTTKPATARIF